PVKTIARKHFGVCLPSTRKRGRSRADWHLRGCLSDDLPRFLLESNASQEQCQESSPCRSEEHTSELQSRSDLVCRLLLVKKQKRLDASSLSVARAVKPHVAEVPNVLPSGMRGR